MMTRISTGGRAPYISGKQEGVSLVDRIAGIKMRVALMDDDLLDQDTTYASHAWLRSHTKTRNIVCRYPMGRRLPVENQIYLPPAGTELHMKFGGQAGRVVSVMMDKHMREPCVSITYTVSAQLTDRDKISDKHGCKSTLQRRDIEGADGVMSLTSMINRGAWSMIFEMGLEWLHQNDKEVTEESLIESLSHLSGTVKVDGQEYECTIGTVTVFIMPQTACEGVTTRVKSQVKCKPNNEGIHWGKSRPTISREELWITKALGRRRFMRSLNRKVANKVVIRCLHCGAIPRGDKCDVCDAEALEPVTIKAPLAAAIGAAELGSVRAHLFTGSNTREEICSQIKRRRIEKVGSENSGDFNIYSFTSTTARRDDHI